jgi:predicted RND superfamily exporter protein
LKISQTIAKRVVSYPTHFILGGLFFLLLFVPGFFNLGFDFSSSSWFSPEDPDLIKVKEFEKIFGNDERLLIIFDTEKFPDPYELKVFNPNFLKILKEVATEVEQLPYVVSVESLHNFYWNFSNEGELSSEQFLDDFVFNSHLENDQEAISYLKEKKNKALSLSQLSKRFLSENQSSALMVVSLQFHPQKAFDYSPLMDAVGELQEQLQLKYPDLSVHLLGEPAINNRFKFLSFKDLAMLVPVVFFLLILYLWLTYRHFLAVLLPMLATVGALLIAIGALGILSFKANTLTFVLPSILLAIAMADSVHLLNTFFSSMESKLKLVPEKNIPNKINVNVIKSLAQESVKESIEKNLYAVFLTSVTTAIGFLSLISSPIVTVVDMGILASIGTLGAMVLSLCWVLPVFLILPEKFYINFVQNINRQNTSLLSENVVRRYLTFLQNNRAWVLATFFFLFLSSLYLGFHNKIDSNPFEYFKKDDPISLANDHALKNFNAFAGPELMILSPERIDREFLLRVENLLGVIEAHPRIFHHYSLMNLVYELRSLLENDQEKRVPDSTEALYQTLLFYSFGAPSHQSLTTLMDHEESKMRVSLFWNIQDSNESLKQVEWMKNEARKLNLDMIVTGKSLLFQKMNELIVSTFFYSIISALFLITTIMIIIFKDFKIGMLSIIPNLFPMILGAGFLKVIDLPIDLGMAIVASVTLGVAVDDTIHFLTHYKAYRRLDYSAYEAVLKVITTTGQALVVTSILLIMAFGIFVFGSLSQNIHFGMMSSFVIFFALVCDLVLLPAMLLKKLKS